MKKWLAVFLILAISLFTVGCGTGEGHWVLVDTEFHEEEWQAELTALNQRQSSYRYDAQVSAGSIVWVNNYTGEEDARDRLFYAIPGNTTTVQCSWTKPPDTVQGSVFEVSMGIKIEVVDQDPAHPMPSGFSFDARALIPDEEGDGVIHSYLSADDGESSFFPSPENGYAPIDVTAYVDMGKGQISGERRALDVIVGGIGHFPLMSYIYEWNEQ